MSFEFHGINADFNDNAIIVNSAVVSSNGVKWKLQLTRKFDGQQYLGIYLVAADTKNVKVVYIFKVVFLILAVAPNVAVATEKTYSFIQGIAANVVESVGSHSFMKFSDFQKQFAAFVSNDGKMRFEVDVTFRFRFYITRPDTAGNTISPTRLRSVHTRNFLTDFTIIVENQRLPVHKLILSLNSDVFSAMFI